MGTTTTNIWKHANEKIVRLHDRLLAADPTKLEAIRELANEIGYVQLRRAATKLAARTDAERRLDRSMARIVSYSSLAKIDAEITLMSMDVEYSHGLSDYPLGVAFSMAAWALVDSRHLVRLQKDELLLLTRILAVAV